VKEGGYFMEKKIDIYTRGLKNKIGFISFGHWGYECSTNYSKTCKEAKAKFCNRYSLDNSQVKACFSK
jgi:hypothetical protein